MTKLHFNFIVKSILVVWDPIPSHLSQISKLAWWILEVAQWMFWAWEPFTPQVHCRQLVSKWQCSLDLCNHKKKTNIDLRRFWFLLQGWDWGNLSSSGQWSLSYDDESFPIFIIICTLIMMMQHFTSNKTGPPIVRRYLTLHSKKNRTFTVRIAHPCMNLSHLVLLLMRTTLPCAR